MGEWVFEGLADFRNLEAIEIVVDTSEFEPRNTEVDNLLYFWNMFWKKTSFCHPGVCCSCCGNIPRISILDRAIGMTEAQELPTREVILGGCSTDYYSPPVEERWRRL